MSELNKNNLPALTSQLADEKVLAPLILSPDEAKIKIGMAPIIMLARENPDLQAIDFISFVRLAQKTGADPERKHIHLITTRKKIKIFDPSQNRQVEQWITRGETWFSYHFFVGKAQETGELALLDVQTEMCDYLNPATGQLIKNTVKSTATCVRKSRVTGLEQKYIYRAYFPEFVKTKQIYQNGQATGQYEVTEAWRMKPYLMNEKCAIANVLRIGFEAELSGMYIPEEMAGEFSPPPGQARDVTPTAPVAEVVNMTENVDPQPTPETESQAVPDTEYQEMGQPEPEHEASRTEVPTKTVAEEIADRNNARVASGPTKARLWSAVQRAGKKGILNPTAAAQRLTQVTLTEDLANALTNKLESGDAAWFHNQ